MHDSRASMKKEDMDFLEEREREAFLREMWFRARDALALFFAYFFFVRVIVSCVRVLSLRSPLFRVPTNSRARYARRNIAAHGKNRNGETAESAEEEAERTGRGRFSGVGEEERGAGEVERAEEASRRWREIR
jgi:hypothetical protein